MFDFAPALWSYQVPFAAAAAAGWTPASLGANLVWWAEPKPANLTKVGGGTPVDGDQVSAITDLSGNSHTLSQGTTGKYPVYHTDGTHYWLTFSGGQFLFSSTSVTIGDASGQHTAFSTVNAPNTTTTQSVLDMDNQNGAGRLSQLLRLNAGNSESIEFNSTGTSFTGVGPAVSINTKHVISEITQTTQVQAFTDGTGGTATTITGTLSTLYGTLNLGCRNAASVTISQPYTGNWYGGFVAKGVVGSTDLASAQTYMAALAP